MELADIAQCPRTGNRLRFDKDASVVHVEDSDMTYPVVDGIIDFCPEAQDTISVAYDSAATRYDAYMTSAHPCKVFMKMFDRVVWGFSDGVALMNTVLSHLPSQFDGILLDVPVGTGLFTSSAYAGFSNATILAVDYSKSMLQEAKKRFLQHGVNNVHLIRADVMNLPVRDGMVDLLVSMNGLHAFADKQHAITEMGRVVREQGTLIACGYFEGARRLSDLFVKHFLARRGFFTPPFLHIDDIASQFEEFAIERQGKFESCAWFEAVKQPVEIRARIASE